MKILLTGASGQLGKCFQEEINKHSYSLIAFARSELDITDYSQVEQIVQRERPDYILNAAAFTNVPNAESNLSDSMKVNAYGPTNLALASEKCEAKLLHISTNFVFAGASKVFEKEDSHAHPINFYGKSKLAGEKLVTAVNLQNSFIVRTSSLFSEFGNNFVNKILTRLSENKQEINVVNDQFCQPTYARDLARQLLYLIQNKSLPGKYHFVNQGETSWFEFAKAITEISGHDKERIVPISSSVFDDGVQRPKSALLLPTTINSGDPINRSWTSALTECLERIKK